MANVARLRLGSVNIGTMRGRYGEVVEMNVRRRLDFCCLQETRWKGEGARMIGDCKFFWIGCDEGTSGVGILVAKSWIEHVIEVKRINQRIYGSQDKNWQVSTESGVTIRTAGG